MKKAVLASSLLFFPFSIVFASPVLAESAESAFSYDRVEARYQFVDYEDSSVLGELTGSNMALILRKELGHQFYVSPILEHASAESEPDIAVNNAILTDVEATATVVGIAVGRYFVLSNQSDLYFQLGYLAIDYENDFKLIERGGRELTINDTDSTSSTSFQFGIRRYITADNKTELTANFNQSFSDDDDSSGIAVGVRRALTETFSIEGSFAQALNEDTRSIGVAAQFYY